MEMTPALPQQGSAAGLHATLNTILPLLLGHFDDPWWLIGSAALHISGVPDIAVHDVDVLVSDAVAMRLPQPRVLLKSEEHTSELQSLMRNSYVVFCLNIQIMYSI